MDKLLKRQLELRNQIKGKVEEARSEEITVEQRGILLDDIELMQQELNTIDSQIERMGVLETQNPISEPRPAIQRIMEGLDSTSIRAREQRTDTNIYDTIEYRNAWAESVRQGNNTIVERFLSAQSTPSAGTLIPTTLQNKIDDTFENDSLLQRYNVTNIKGLTEIPYVESKTDPEWHTEVGGDGKPSKKKEKDVKFNTASLTPEYLSEILKTTKKFEALTIDAFWSWLERELPNAIRRKVLAGSLTAPQSGVYGTRGILTNTDTNLVVKVERNLSFNSGNEAIGSLGDELGELTAVMNKQTFFNDILGMTDTTGKPIFKVLEDNTGKAKYFYNGLPVEFNSNIPEYSKATAGESYMIIGDLKAYQLNFPLGYKPEVLRDPYTESDVNIIKYRSEIMVGGNVTKRHSIAKLVKVAEG